MAEWLLRQCTALCFNWLLATIEEAGCERTAATRPSPSFVIDSLGREGGGGSRLHSRADRCGNRPRRASDGVS